MLFEHLFDLQRELDNIFEKDFSYAPTFSRGVFPAINMFEKGDTLLLKAEIPGIDKKDIKIEIKDNSLYLAGERKYDEKNDVSYHRRERTSGTFRRQIALPYKVDPEKISAKLEDGVLTLEIEKADEVKPREITIN